MCELAFLLKDGSKLNLDDLRKAADAGDSVLDKIKDSKMKVVWPHERPPPTGEVRMKLIHQRMHKKQEERISGGDYLSPAQAMNTLSNGFIILITVPLIAYALYNIFQWFGMDPERAKVISIILSFIFLIAEIGLALIQMYKTDKTKEYFLKQFNSPTKMPHISKPKMD